MIRSSEINNSLGNLFNLKGFRKLARGTEDEESYLSARQKPDNEPLLFHVVSDAAIWGNDIFELMFSCC